MLEQKAFLQAACGNVHRLLEGVLRFEYASHIHEAVFLTLQKRIYLSEKNLEKAELNALEGIAADLSAVAEVVALVEKSHVGEFSWAFVDHFVDLASKACKHVPAPSLADGATEDNTNATINRVGALNNVHFFFSSNSSLYNYQVHREIRGNDQGGSKIFNVQFPRAFKESVLLHGLLAHEIGHTLIDVNKSKWMSLIDDAFKGTPLFLDRDANLGSTDKVTASSAAENWVRSWTKTQTEVRLGNVSTITEEIFCDIVGLLLIGPTFIFALAQLLWAISPIGEGKTQLPYYPPFRVRLGTLLAAAKLLGWDQLVDTKAWEKVKPYGYKTVKNGDDLFTNDQIESLISSLQKALPSDVCFTTPNRKTIEAVKEALIDRLPPGATTIEKRRNSTDQHDVFAVNMMEMDFRDVLLAGWEVVSTEPPPNSQLATSKSWQEKFQSVNKFCEKGLVNLLAAKAMNGGAL